MKKLNQITVAASAAIAALTLSSCGEKTVEDVQQDAEKKVDKMEEKAAEAKEEAEKKVEVL
jgi:outer membrane lipoprotein-sorting protein